MRYSFLRETPTFLSLNELKTSELLWVFELFSTQIMARIFLPETSEVRNYLVKG